MHPITSQRVPYAFTLTSVRSTLNLRWSATIFRSDGADDGAFASVRLSSPEREEIYGFGLMYSRWNVKGASFPIISSEQGIGRGLEPVTRVLNTRLGGREGPTRGRERALPLSPSQLWESVEHRSHARVTRDTPPLP